MTFSPYISLYAIILIAANLLSALYIATFYRRFITRVYRRKKIQDSMKAEAANLPTMSVIVYCRDNASKLNNLLKSLLYQDYEPGYEIIVVNDGSSEDVKDVVNLHLASHKNLYLTFIPSQAHNLSRRKLAITLGVKAARNGHVIITNADAVIDSRQWLRRMSQPIADGKDIVIGHASCADGIDTNLGSSLRSFDRLADAAAWLGSAIGHNPFRGTNYNFAFSRKLFFDNKGFSRSLNLHNGDDDIFVSEIATRDNCEVMLAEESQVRCDLFNPRKIHDEQKISHLFTRRFVSHKASWMMSTGSWTMWIWLATAIATISLSYPNMFPVAVVAVIALILWTLVYIAWIRISKTLHEKINPRTIIFLCLFRPFYNFWFKLKSRFGSYKNYTWM